MFLPLLRAMLLATCFLQGMQAIAQNKAELRFVPLRSNKPLQLEGGLASGDSVRVNLFRFYISRLCLLRQQNVVWKDDQPAHLIDAADARSCRMSLPENLPYDAVQFLLGIDSITNATGAAGGDLDPMKGMYWAWQSGYINIKIEGSSRLCATRKNAFQFHLGGFRGEDGCAQLLQFSAVSGKDVFVAVDVDAFLSNVNLKTQATIMSPGPEAGTLSRKMVAAFRLSATP